MHCHSNVIRLSIAISVLYRSLKTVEVTHIFTMTLSKGIERWETPPYLDPSGGQVFFLGGKSRVSRPVMAACAALSKWTLVEIVG